MESKFSKPYFFTALFFGMLFFWLSLFGVIDITRAWTNPSGNPPLGTGSGLTGLGTAGNISKYTSSNNLGNSGIYEDGTGNVGVGTTVPGAKLDVVGTVKATGVNFPTGAGVGKVLTSDAGGIGTWQAPATYLNGGGTVNYVGKFTGTGTIGNSQVFDDGTNVGIGTSTPGYKLDVNGNAIVRNRLTVSEAGGAYTYLALQDDESPNGVKYIHANSNVVGFLSGGGSWLSYWDNVGNQQNMASITAGGNITANGEISRFITKLYNNLCFTCFADYSALVSTYSDTIKRLTIYLDGGGTTTKFLRIPESYINSLCRDVDGCTITLGMKDWNITEIGSVASRGPYRFFYSPASNYWKISNTDAASLNNNGANANILGAWACNFVDGDSSASSGTVQDNTLDFGLYFDRTFYTAAIQCVMIIDD